MKVINPFKEVFDGRINYIEYTTQPVMYKDYLVVYNPKGSYDVVRAGVCIAQRVTKQGAKGFIDLIYSEPNDYFVKRSLGYLTQWTK